MAIARLTHVGCTFAKKEEICRAEREKRSFVRCVIVLMMIKQCGCAGVNTANGIVYDTSACGRFGECTYLRSIDQLDDKLTNLGRHGSGQLLPVPGIR